MEIITRCGNYNKLDKGEKQFQFRESEAILNKQSHFYSLTRFPIHLGNSAYSQSHKKSSLYKVS